ncbi:MAG: outer membrane protein assembly factor BamB family protein [Thermogutta sp.]
MSEKSKQPLPQENVKIEHSPPREGERAGENQPTGPLAGFYAALRTAIVSGIFVLVIAALLLWSVVRPAGKDPLDSPRYAELQKRLILDPQNESLKQEIRDLDLQLRRAYFRERSFQQWGTTLLIAGLIVFAVAARIASTLRRPLPHPTAGEIWDEAFDRATGQRRSAMLTFTGILIMIVVAFWAGGKSIVRDTLVFRTMLDGQSAEEVARADGRRTQPVPSSTTLAPGEAGSEETKPKPLEYNISREDYNRFWPRFRGPDGSGVSPHPDPPVTWDGQRGDGVLWKVPVELPGRNSPVVWDKRIFVTGATAERRCVYCFDADSGKLIWQRDVEPSPASQNKKPKVTNDTGFAAPTVATDGLRVYAIFANGDLAAVDFEGNLLWVKGFGIPDNAYGHASSLCTYRDQVIVQLDQGTPDDKLSKLLAIKGATGEVAWEVTRPTGNAWTSPIIVQAGDREQLITVADPFVISYNPADGKEWWRFEGTTGDCGPSPIFHRELVIAGGEYSYYMFAIRGDGTGNVTENHKVWEAEDFLPDTCSPLAFDRYVLWMSSGAILACYDVEKGELLWEHEFPENTFYSSPALAGGKVYLFSREGPCFVGVVSDEEFKIEQTNNLGEGCVTSPAFQPGRIYIRGEKHLFCLGR